MEVKDLVSRLQDRIDKSATHLDRLRINDQSADTYLDDIFLAKEFDKLLFIEGFPVVQLEETEDTSQEYKVLDRSLKRLKQYLDSLKEHIVSIVEQESEEFL